MFDSVTCEVNRADLATGDILVLYTDGITEAENPQEEEFGMDRLSDLIRRGSMLSAEELATTFFGVPRISVRELASTTTPPFS